MKIETELRYAINAAAKAQKPLGWQEEEAAFKQAADEFLKRNPAKARKLASLREKWIKAKAASELAASELDSEVEKYGLNRSLTVPRRDDDSHGLFVAAGGKLPDLRRREWKAEEVISKLAAATTPKQFAAVLADYGINWN